MIRYAIFAIIFAATCGAVYLGGISGAATYERMTEDRIRHGLSIIGIDWVQVQADGTRVELRGRAPSVDAQALALQTAMATAPFAHVVDFSSATLTPLPPREPIMLELHRDPEGLTLTGRLYGSRMKEAFIGKLGKVLPGTPIHDLSGDNAERPPKSWGAELDLALLAVDSLSDAFLAVEPGRVRVDGVVPDQSAKDSFSAQLLALAGPEIALDLNLRVPPRAIAPFEFIAEKDAKGIQVVKCAARNEAERDRLTALLKQAGVAEQGRSCAYGLGGPEGNWAGVIEAGIATLSGLPSGRFSVAYNDVTLTGRSPTTAQEFATAIEALEASLDPSFALSHTLLDVDGREETPVTAYWLKITIARKNVRLEGRMPSEAEREALAIYGKALFAGYGLENQIQLSGNPAPRDWQIAAQQVLQSLSALGDGQAEVSDRRLRIEGKLEDPIEAGVLHRELAAALPDFDVSTQFTVDLPRSIADLPMSGPACLAEMNRILVSEPVAFATGEAKIESASGAMLDRLAESFQRCERVEISIAGFTDSQGAEDYNQRLSQSRAEAVMDALIARGIPHSLMVATGKGETDPIASNETPEGRAMNRRIEIHAGG